MWYARDAPGGSSGYESHSLPQLHPFVGCHSAGTGIDKQCRFACCYELMKYDEVVGIVYIPAGFWRSWARVKKRYILCTAPLRFSFILLPCKACLREPCCQGMMTPDPSKWFFYPRWYTTGGSKQGLSMVGTALYNYTDGYGTLFDTRCFDGCYFQTLIFVISMLSGKERETGDILMFAGPEGRGSFLFTYGIRSDRKIIYLFSSLCFIILSFVGAFP